MNFSGRLTMCVCTRKRTWLNRLNLADLSPQKIYARIQIYFCNCYNLTIPITEGRDPQFDKLCRRDWHNKISYQLPEDAYVDFFPHGAVLRHARVSKQRAGCKDSPVSVTSAASRAQPHSLRPGIKLSVHKDGKLILKVGAIECPEEPINSATISGTPTRQTSRLLPSCTVHFAQEHFVARNKKLFIHNGKF
jgi:hypothetical protein